VSADILFFHSFLLCCVNLIAIRLNQWLQMVQSRAIGNMAADDPNPDPISIALQKNVNALTDLILLGFFLTF
jgi:hypothetical protein